MPGHGLKAASQLRHISDGRLPLAQIGDQQPASSNGPTNAFVEVGRLQPAGLQDGIKFEAVRTPTQWFPR